MSDSDDPDLARDGDDGRPRIGRGCDPLARPEQIKEQEMRLKARRLKQQTQPSPVDLLIAALKQRR